MPDIYFPPQLPNGLRESHTARPVQPFVRTPMAAGQAKQRRAFTNVPVMHSWSWIFTDVEARLFEAWFRDMIRDGADWFKIARKTPMGMELLTCRFASMYTGPTLVGRSHWRFTAELECRDRTILPPGWGLFPDYILHADIIDLAANVEWPAWMPPSGLTLLVSVDGETLIPLQVSTDGINLYDLTVNI